MVVEKQVQLFTRCSSPNTLFHIARRIILSLSLTEHPAVLFMQVCSADYLCNSGFLFLLLVRVHWLTESRHLPLVRLGIFLCDRVKEGNISNLRFSVVFWISLKHTFSHSKRGLDDIS